MITFRRRSDDVDDEATTSSTDGDGVFASTYAVYLFAKKRQTVKVWWRIGTETSMLDWIGLFSCEDSSQYLDQKPLRSTSSPLFFTLSKHNLLHFRGVYFGYVHGVTGRMLAKSRQIDVCSRARLVIHRVGHEMCSGDGIRLHYDGKDVDVPFAMKQDINIESPSCTLQVVVRDSNFTHSFSPHQLDEDVARSVDPRGGVYRVDVEFSTVPVVDSNRVEGGGMKSSTSAVGGFVGPSSSNSSTQTDAEAKLPSGWQVCFDAKGRRFYMDHNTKTTSWMSPGATTQRRVVSQKTRLSRISHGHNNNNNYNKNNAINNNNNALITPRRTTAHNDEADVANFLRRGDFFTLLHEKKGSLAIYNSSSLVRHAVHHVRQNLEAPSKFENCVKFVEFVNAFADCSEPLPIEWSLLAHTNPNVFVHHATRRTTLFDPRVRTLHSQKTHRGFSAPPRNSTATAKGENSLLSGHKLEEIAAVADRKLPQIAGRVREKLRLVQRFGEIAVASLTNDLDLSLAISMLDVEQDNEAKKQDVTLNLFYSELQRARYGRGPGKLNWRFSRDSLLGDALQQVLATDVFALRKSRLFVSFDDENALDYGGPSREFFYLLSRELFDPNNGLFMYAESDYTLQLCPAARGSSNTRKLELCGRILALALVHRCLIDVFFTAPFYKQLLKQRTVLEDFVDVDASFHNSMTWILENNVEQLDLTFVAESQIDGELVETELVAGGGRVHVTESNKFEFVGLMCGWAATKGVEEQTRTLLRAFYQVIDRDLVGILSVDQLRVALSGNMEVDLVDWRRQTVYKGGYFDGHVVVKWFWEAVEQMSNADRLRLLLFVTGSSSVPFEGFGQLRGTNGANKFCIEKWGDEKSLPRAHTCFNRLQLPSYSTKQSLRAKLMRSVADGMAYSIE